MKIERVEEMRLTDGQEGAIANLMADCMSLDYDGRSFFQNRFTCRFLALVENTIVGHLAVDFRAIRMGDQIVDVIGIGDVAVSPAHRRQGIGRSLVDACLNDGKASKAKFALLFGVRSIYTDAGFKPAGNIITSIKMRGVQTGEIVREANGAFKVCQLGEQTWDETAPVDLAGYPF